MARTIISTDQAPAAIGTYSQAVRVGNTVYVSGTCGVEADGSVAPDMYGQAKRALEIIKAALAQESRLQRAKPPAGLLSQETMDKILASL